MLNNLVVICHNTSGIWGTLKQVFLHQTQQITTNQEQNPGALFTDKDWCVDNRDSGWKRNYMD